MIPTHRNTQQTAVCSLHRALCHTGSPCVITTAPYVDSLSIARFAWCFTSHKSPVNETSSCCLMPSIRISLKRTWMLLETNSAAAAHPHSSSTPQKSHPKLRRRTQAGKGLCPSLCVPVTFHIYPSESCLATVAHTSCWNLYSFQKLVTAPATWKYPCLERKITL